MLVTRKGEVIKDDDLVLMPGEPIINEEYVVCVYKSKKDSCIKQLVGEVQYPDFPTREQIIFALGKFNGNYASIRKVYILESETSSWER